MDINYDSSVLELVGGSVSVSGAIGDFDDMSGLGVFMSLQPLSVSGSIASATFRVREDAGIGASTSISASVTLTPSEGSDINLNVSLGSYTVTCSHKNKQSYAQQDATCKEGGYTAGEYCPDCETWVSGHTEIPVSTTHTYGAWTKISDTQHKHICSVCEKEETENHTWNDGVVTTPATHTTTGVKTLTCTKCGATKTETIEKTTEHNYGAWTKISDTQHKHTCECGAEETENHTWNGGSVTTPATHTKTGVKTYTCTKCGATKTETIPVSTTHDYSKWEKVDESTHKHTCKDCGKEETASHRWNFGVITKPATHTAEGVRTYTCSDCGATKTETIPATTEHNYGEWAKKDDNTHKHTCECGEEETEAHTWNTGAVTTEPTCKDEGVKTYTCTKCGASKTETIPKLTTHTYTNDCDPDCNVCGETREVTHQYRTEWSYNGESHWHTCTVCGVREGEAAHTPGPAATETAPQVCTVCGYIIAPALGHTHNYASAYTSDENGHWYACSGCSEKKDYAAHVYDNGCDKTCNVCGYERAAEHKYDSAWHTDETGHWHECKCGEKSDYAAHDYEIAVEDNSVVYTCKCGYIKTQPVEKDEPVVIAVEQSEAGTETATVSSELIEQITENTEHGILIELGSGTTVEYDKSALSTIASSAAGNDVTLAVENVGSDAPGMNEQQKQTVADLPAGSTVISLTLKAGETEIHDFGGGKATVTVPFTLPEGWKAEEVIVYRIEDDGTKTPMNTSFSDGSVTWETDGHSYYVVSRSTEKTTPAPKLGLLPIVIIAVVAVMALAGVTLLIVKKKKS